ncbi:MAG: hypothetical protein U1E15_07635 [Hyphomicrobiales bacterium]
MTWASPPPVRRCWDLPREDTTAAIASRAYSRQPHAALALARAHTDGFAGGATASDEVTCRAMAAPWWIATTNFP